MGSRGSSKTVDLPAGQSFLLRARAAPTQEKDAFFPESHGLQAPLLSTAYSWRPREILPQLRFLQTEAGPAPARRCGALRGTWRGPLGAPSRGCTRRHCGVRSALSRFLVLPGHEVPPRSLVPEARMTRRSPGRPSGRREPWKRLWETVHTKCHLPAAAPTVGTPDPFLEQILPWAVPAPCLGMQRKSASRHQNVWSVAGRKFSGGFFFLF